MGGLEARQQVQDIANVAAYHLLQEADIITATLPCQSTSTLGLRWGQADGRDLWWPWLRLLDRVRPAWAIADAVTGLAKNINMVTEHRARAGLIDYIVHLDTAAVRHFHPQDRVRVAFISVRTDIAQ
eukprot:11982310-Alexandrium_andersonii.AAC.1